MRNDVQVSLRMPAEVKERVAAVEQAMAKNRSMSAFRVSEQVVMRMALMRGLDILEAEFIQGGHVAKSEPHQAAPGPRRIPVRTPVREPLKGTRVEGGPSNPPPLAPRKRIPRTPVTTEG